MAATSTVHTAWQALPETAWWAMRTFHLQYPLPLPQLLKIFFNAALGSGLLVCDRGGQGRAFNSHSHLPLRLADFGGSSSINLYPSTIDPPLAIADWPKDGNWPNSHPKHRGLWGAMVREFSQHGCHCPNWTNELLSVATWLRDIVLAVQWVLEQKEPGTDTSRLQTGGTPQ